VTVTGAAPVVDVQSSQRREVLTADALEALPTGRTFSTVAKAVPAVAGQAADVGGSTSSEFRGGVFAYGGPGEQIMVDGMACWPDSREQVDMMQKHVAAVSLGALLAFGALTHAATQNSLIQAVKRGDV
jgi:hypothetical protein